MDQNNQTSEKPVSEKSKKSVYVIIAIVVALIVIFYLLRGSLGMMGRVNGVNIKQNFDGTATYSNSEGTVTVGNNKMPDNWPSDAPTYANAKIQYSGSSNPQTGEKGSAVVFMTTDSAQMVVDFYKQNLASNGWTVEQTATMGASSILAAKKDNRTFSAYITDAGNGQVSATISVSMPGSK